MGERNGFGRALGVENISTVPAVVFSVCKTESGSAAHTHVGINPFWGLGGGQRLSGCAQRRKTHGTAIKHTA